VSLTKRKAQRPVTLNRKQKNRGRVSFIVGKEKKTFEKIRFCMGGLTRERGTRMI